MIQRNKSASSMGKSNHNCTEEEWRSKSLFRRSRVEQSVIKGTLHITCIRILTLWIIKGCQEKI